MFHQMMAYVMVSVIYLKSSKSLPSYPHRKFRRKGSWRNHHRTIDIVQEQRNELLQYLRFSSINQRNLPWDSIACAEPIYPFGKLKKYNSHRFLASNSNIWKGKKVDQVIKIKSIF